MIDYRGFPIPSAGMAWLEIASLVGLTLLFLVARRITIGRRFKISEAFIGGFFIWFQIGALLLFAAFLIVPAYLLTGLLLVAASVFSDEQLREFMQGHFYAVFIPAYLVIAGIAVIYLRRAYRA